MRLRESAVIALALGAVLVGGLSGQAQAGTSYNPQPSHSSSVVAHNTALGREFVLLENEPDSIRQEQIADSIVSPGYIQHNAIVPPGRAGMLTFFHGIRVSMPDIKFTSRDVFATEDRAVSRFTITGTVTGAPFLGIAPSGQKLEWDGVDIWTVQDGQLYEHWDQFDWPRALVQLGVQGLPQPFVQAAAQPPNR